MIEILGIHVPKAAGTNIFQLLGIIYGNKLHHDNAIISPHYPVIEEHKKVIWGHFNFWRWDSKYPNAKKITFIRHPLERAVSHYEFWKQAAQPDGHPEAWAIKQGELSFEDFIVKYSNYMSRFYVPIENIKDFEFIGLVEEYDKSMKVFFEIVNNGDWIKHDRQNVNKNGKIDHWDVSLKHRRLIERVNKEDYKLYYKIEERWT